MRMYTVACVDFYLNVSQTHTALLNTSVLHWLNLLLLYPNDCSTVVVDIISYTVFMLAVLLAVFKMYNKYTS